MNTAGRSVLVADADVHTRYLLARSLRDAGFQTVQAGSGSAALDYAGHVSAAVLAVDLPDINGLEVCRILRSRVRTAAMPVIHLSSADDNEQAAGQAGASAYLRRPLDHDTLAATVMTLLERGPRHSPPHARGNVSAVVRPER